MNTYSFNHLAWDTEYFGTKCCRVILDSELTADDWKKLHQDIQGYHFVTIRNQKGNRNNNTYIGEHCEAFLADVNVLLKCDLNRVQPVNECSQITISNNYPFSSDITKLTPNAFAHSRFINDSHIHLEKANGIYENWLNNAFLKSDKYFCVYKDESNIEGFILFSEISKDLLDIELICVNSVARSKGIGSIMMGSLFNYAQNNGYEQIIVGTQLENIGAINFYVKNSFSITDFNYIYHLWK